MAYKTKDHKREFTKTKNVIDVIPLDIFKNSPQYSMIVELAEVFDGYGLYKLPERPSDPVRPMKVIAKVRGRFLELKGWVFYDENTGWLLALPIAERLIDILYMEPD